jgi:hypothetical protein
MRYAAIAMACALLAYSLSVRVVGHPVGKVTWSREVVKILGKHCVSCHRDGGSASPSLTEYAEARRWARTIRTQVLERRMPLWSAAEGVGDFANNRGLSPLEIDLIVAWVDGNTLVGTTPPQRPPSASAPAPRVPDADMVLSVPAVARSGNAPLVVDIPTGVPGETWISGWAFEPSPDHPVRQALLSVGDVPLGTWLPSDGVTRLPDRVAQRLPSGAQIRVALTYPLERPQRPDGQHKLALFFSRKPAHELRHLVLPCGQSRVPRDIQALALRPHAESSGSAVEAVARRRDGTVEPLLWVRNYRDDYQLTYLFRRPVVLRKGTQIEIGSSISPCEVYLAYIDR